MKLYELLCLRNFEWNIVGDSIREKGCIETFISLRPQKTEVSMCFVQVGDTRPLKIGFDQKCFFKALKGENLLRFI